MARLAGLVIPGLPHHVTQRGNRRQPTFFNDGDYAAYLELMADWRREEGVEIWGYCLMPNHVRLIAVPKTEDGLRRAIGEAHRHYTRRINFREKWRGQPVGPIVRIVVFVPRALPSLLHTSRCAMFVPEGRLIIAQQFTAGR